MMERSSMQGGRYTYGTRWGALCCALMLFLGFGLASIPGTARAAGTTVLTVTNLTDSANNPAAGSLRAAIRVRTGTKRPAISARMNPERRPRNFRSIPRPAASI